MTTDLAYPIAVGVAAAGHGLALAATLEVFVVSVVGHLVSAAVAIGFDRADRGATDYRGAGAPLSGPCRLCQLRLYRRPWHRGLALGAFRAKS
jgi:urease accessory protein